MTVQGLFMKYNALNYRHPNCHSFNVEKLRPIFSIGSIKKKKRLSSSVPFNVPIFRNVCFQNYLKEYWIYTRGIIFAIEWRLMFAAHSHKVHRHSRLLNCMRAHTRDQASPLMKFNLMGLPYLNLASTPDHSYYLSWYFSICASWNRNTRQVGGESLLQAILIISQV